VAAAHADASKEPWLAEIRWSFPPRLDAVAGRGKVLATGQPELLPVVTPEALAASARDGRHLKLLHNLAPRSSMSVPLRRDGRVLGAITFVSSAAQRRFGPDDLVFATDLARRVAESLDAGTGAAGVGAGETRAAAVAVAQGA
jgi:GAF domain-containing protein